jgi:hypothetical protein
VLEQRYEKTDAGRTEIKQRALVNARVARNLLLVISPEKSAADWLGLVQGAGVADLELLLQHGLVAAAQGAPAPTAAAQASASVSRLDYGALYAALSAHAKAQGVLKGYKLALEVEQCQDLAQLQALALDFIERQRLARGDAAARALAQTLGF